MEAHLRRQKSFTYDMTFGDIERLLAALLPGGRVGQKGGATESAPDRRTPNTGLAPRRLSAAWRRWPGATIHGRKRLIGP
jgi:hypothetical protein